MWAAPGGVNIRPDPPFPLRIAGPGDKSHRIASAQVDLGRCIG